MRMRPKKVLPPGTLERMEVLMKEVTTVSEFKRVQSVYLRAKFDKNAGEIGDIVGFKAGMVRNVHYEYIKYGETSLLNSKKGGRHNSYLEKSEELDFLKEFDKEGNLGNLLEISKIRESFGKRVGKKIAKTTIYRLLARHGWRKVSPRPKHPKNDKIAMEEFKKNFQR